MVQSSASNVDEYMAQAEPDRLSALQQIRSLCLEYLPGWEERMQWGMPGYGPSDSDAVVSFNSQKNYISVYPGKSALELHRGSLKGASFGGGCVRFPRPERIDFGAIAEMLQHVYSNGRGATR